VSERRPISSLGWRVLEAVYRAGGVLEPAALVGMASDPRAIYGTLGHLSSRFFVRLVPGRVLLTPGGMRLCARRFPH